MSEAVPPGLGRGRPILGATANSSNFPSAHPYGSGTQTTLGTVSSTATASNTSNASANFPSSKLNIDAKEFVPTFFVPPSNELLPVPEEGYYEGAEGDTDCQPWTDPVEVTKNTMDALIAQPGSFDDVVPYLTDFLRINISDEEALTATAVEIVEQAIHEPNFQYTAAKLCNHLVQNLGLKFDSNDFLAVLLAWCLAEHNRRREHIDNKQKKYRDRLIGFTFFMAELLSKLHSEFDNEPFAPLAKAVKELLETLLSSPDDSTMKCVGQVLKLTGQQIDSMERKNPGQEPRLEKVMDLLKGVIVESNCHRSIKMMLLNVLEQRADNWGSEDADCGGAKTSAVTSSVAVPPPAVDNLPLNDTVYYTASGQVIPNEQVTEKQRREADQQQYSDEDWANQEEFYNMSEFYNQLQHEASDDEMSAAYEAFLGETNNGNNYPHPS